MLLLSLLVTQMLVRIATGEVVHVMRHKQYQTSLNHGCTACSKLEKLLLVSDQAHPDV